MYPTPVFMVKTYLWITSLISSLEHLENLFCAPSPELQGPLTRNLVGSIRVTCRSKIAKMVPIRNQKMAAWQPS